MSISSPIQKVAVLGAGVMGSGIAAHLANAGVPVLLLDMETKTVRNAIERMQKQKPAPFMSPQAIKLIESGSFEQDLKRIGDCDWIVEVVVEDADIKRSLYRRIEPLRKPGSIISSNTSGIPLADLIKGMPQRFQRDFAITHFFNPPRYMGLLELVHGEAARPEAVQTLREFCDVYLGKNVVPAKDTPGFIANRIGFLLMNAAVYAALELGLTVEEADAIAGRPMGFPGTGIFGLMDLVGLDLLPHVARNMRAKLPKDDPAQTLMDPPPVVTKMLERGLTGRKGPGGFYRLNRDSGKRTKQVIDLASGEYRASTQPDLASIKTRDLKTLLEYPDRGGQFAWRLLSQVLSYAASLVPEIADEITAVDEAMRAGYNWKYGPFELLDRIGADYFTRRLQAAGLPVPAILQTMQKQGLASFYRVERSDLQYLALDGSYRPVTVLPDAWRLADIKRKSKQVAGNASASLWDIGHGVACLEFHSKMNSIDQGTLAMMVTARELVEKDFAALVIGNDADNFCVGANLGMLLFPANVGLWQAIEQLVKNLQDAVMGFKYAPFPVVGAPAGLALGGGCELLLHCAAIQAHAELYTGLVEVGVGLVPAGGGSKEMITRHSLNRRGGGFMPATISVFENIAMAKVSTSAAEARQMGILRPSDGISMNRRRVLADAKARALDLAKDYHPPQPQELYLAGASGRAALKLAVWGMRLAGKVSDYDAIIADHVARIITGGDTDLLRPVSEATLLRLEREAFMDLARRDATLARIEHMLDTGKPLRN
ncbi:MAG TPA: 3-hydroxyacyl-CoA dehydrogenase NAD-binding domain-containing protein [Acidiferrobacterales bacterium]|nr:3-hydroxyacyl-CoA dehydrogenase NAD-binding domain-containing protein [Acidiferrobacterales bacterium]